MAKLISPNFKFLVDTRREGFAGALLEGSSRSTKTWGSIDNIVHICSKVETDATINIIKETYNSFKTTLYDDFNRRLPMYGIQSPFADKQEVKSFKLFGNKINLLGADSPSLYHGTSCDYFYGNEILDISKEVFDQAEQRCRKFWWGDYNPKTSNHWVYKNVAGRSDVRLLRTTFLDNPYISAMEKRKILSYEPTHPDDRGLSVEERRPHPTNIKDGTADDFMWNVYGLGLRSAPEGIIFQHVNWVKEFPKNVEKHYWGSDIGQTISPSTVVHAGVKGRDLYIERRGYGPTPTPDQYIDMIKAAGVKNDYIIADSAEPGYISDARKAGIKILAANKFNGSIRYGIAVLKKYRLHIVDCPEWRNEQENYKFRVINGIKLDEPIDDFNHLWDALRYIAITYLRDPK